MGLFIDWDGYGVLIFEKVVVRYLYGDYDSDLPSVSWTCSFLFFSYFLFLIVWASTNLYQWLLCLS